MSHGQSTHHHVADGELRGVDESMVQVWAWHRGSQRPATGRPRRRTHEHTCLQVGKFGSAPLAQLLYYDATEAAGDPGVMGGPDGLCYPRGVESARPRLDDGFAAAVRRVRRRGFRPRPVTLEHQHHLHGAHGLLPNLARHVARFRHRVAGAARVPCRRDWWRSGPRGRAAGRHPGGPPRAASSPEGGGRRDRRADRGGEHRTRSSS